MKFRMSRARSVGRLVWQEVGLASVAGVTIVLLIACSGGGEATPTSAGTAPSTTTAPTTTATTTTTTTEPPPLTAEEQAWWRQINRYAARLEKDWFREEVAITHAVMRHWSSVFGKCRTTLEEAGDPGRYAPAARVVRRACAKLTKAKAHLAIAIDASDPAGAVIAGTPEEAQFNRALDRLTALASNALNDFTTAQDKVATITAEYGT
jgi:hypothetical protein